MEPRKVIGSIDTSEFLVALAASLGFLLALGSQGVDFAWVAVLLLGGLIAAPIAAWLVRHIPPRMLGSLVGGVIVLTNTRTLLKSDWIDAPDSTRIPIYVAIYLVWAAAVVWSYLQYRKDKALESADAIAALAEAEGISEADVVATSAPLERAALESDVSAGRPSAPQD